MERFDAHTVSRLVTRNAGRRFEMQFRDAAGRDIVVSLPLRTAVELGCMICEVSQHAPYLVGGHAPVREGLPAASPRPRRA
jgi:hypothetical protein